MSEPIDLDELERYAADVMEAEAVFAADSRPLRWREVEYARTTFMALVEASDVAALIRELREARAEIERLRAEAPGQDLVS